MIKLQQVSKIYEANHTQVQALESLDLTLNQTGFLCIVGPSGCGKTTLLNLLGGLDTPTSGTITIQGKDSKTFTEKEWCTYRNQHIGFVFQNSFLIPHLSVLDNVMLPLSLSGKSKVESQALAINSIKHMGIKDKTQVKPRELSGGQQQKVAISRALINAPSIILADEPTGSLDEASAIEIMEILKEISQTKLVILVTHQHHLAQRYADRIISMHQGRVVSDVEKSKVKPSVIKENNVHQQSYMSKKTSWMLSCMNLLQRKYRSMLMVIAASLGVIGMLLVLAVSYGFHQFLDVKKSETLYAFPIRVERISYVVPFVDDQFRPNLTVFPSSEDVHIRNIQYEYQTINTLTENYYTYVKNMPSHMVSHIHYDYEIKSNFIVHQDTTYHEVQNVLKPLEVDLEYMENNFDVLYGRTPDVQNLEAVIILDRYNRLSKDIAEAIGYSNETLLQFSNLTDLSMKWVPNQVMYVQNGNLYEKNSLEDAFHDDLAQTLTIVGILRVKDKFELDFLRTGIYYTEKVTQTILEDARTSDIVIAQQSASTHVITGQSLSTTQKDQVLRSLGYATYPLSYHIYANRFEDKKIIMNYLRAYNEMVSMTEEIEPLDIAGIGLSTMQNAINATSTILFVFALISLVISNLMMGIMTYTSVIERTKEIGLLRAIGARKKDIKSIFYVENFIIGLISGLISVMIAFLLIPVMNTIILSYTSIANVAKLSFFYVVLVLVIHVVLTMVSGFIPARYAARLQPMKALKVE